MQYLLLSMQEQSLDSTFIGIGVLGFMARAVQQRKNHKSGGSSNRKDISGQEGLG